jgi:glycosyltransferase involved in cell wall biosynthesis
MNTARLKTYFSRGCDLLQIILISRICLFFNRQKKHVFYISDGADWIIGRIGSSIYKGIDKKIFTFSSVFTARYIRESLVHFGSLWGFYQASQSSSDPTNHIVVNVYHGDYGIDKSMDLALDMVVQQSAKLSRIIVSTSIMQQRLQTWGIPSDKITRIPIGVDIGIFRMRTEEQKKYMRKTLGIPDDAIVIGSFQKDGCGWGDGDEPKLIKGPDVFVDVVTKLRENYKIHCLLTGPARGYVKKRLKNTGVPFTHQFVMKFDELQKWYACCDLYLVTSREEGGPAAILESMASGVPVVSTKVGMAVDLITDGKNGRLCAINDKDDLMKKTAELLGNSRMYKDCIEAGRLTAIDNRWEIIAGKYEELYNKILNENR